MTTSSVGDELREESGFEFVHDEGAFIPFSHGPANCVGTEALAMRQMRVVVTVCALVQRFRVALNPGEEEGDGDGGRCVYKRAFRDYLVANRPKVRVVLERRW